MIIILYYYICGRSVCVRVCVRLSTYVHPNVGLCADACVYASVGALMCVYGRALVYACVCALVSGAAHVFVNAFSCACGRSCICACGCRRAYNMPV